MRSTGARYHHEALVKEASDDLVSIEELSEDSLLAQIQQRHGRHRIYTSVSDILIAVNPFRKLEIYEDHFSRAYQSQPKGELPPHIFSVSTHCYHLMSQTGRTQCCVISGESGAGKTETTKHFVKHVLHLAEEATGGGVVNASKKVIDLGKRINSINPILESFGNAKTVMNDNSSRFGKYLQLHFSPSGAVLGASISQYLLEKARVTQRNDGEANFHIFYAFLQGLDSTLQNTFQISSQQQFRYARADASPFSASDAAAMFKEAMAALEELAFPEKDRNNVLSLIATILHTGEMEFSTDESTDGAVLATPDRMELVASLLGVSPSELADSLTLSVTITRGERIARLNSAQDARDTRDTLAKELYGRLFEWLITALNAHLSPPESNQHLKVVDDSNRFTIGVLDIFGFENFSYNCFEQLCINLANEQLQFYFNQHVFAWEAEEFAQEGLSTAHISFVDNRELLDLYLKKHLGLIDLLDQESFFPSASPESFCRKMHETWGENAAVYQAPRDAGATFGIHHYAGTVNYKAARFLTKNRDPFPKDISDVLLRSENEFVADIFSEGFAKRPAASSKDKERALTLTRKASSKAMLNLVDQTKSKGLQRTQTMKEGKKKTIATFFKESLAGLMDQMLQAEPSFVRCIKPNSIKSPTVFDREYVLKQLRYTGVLETVRIRRDGFPIRLKLKRFCEEFAMVAFPYLTFTQVDPSQVTVKKVLNKIKTTGWLLGHTKVFLKASHREELLQLRKKLAEKVVHSQRFVRGFVARKKYTRLLPVMEDERKRVEDFLGFIESKQVRERMVKTVEEGRQRLQAEVKQTMDIAASIAAAVLKKKMERDAKRTDSPLPIEVEAPPLPPPPPPMEDAELMDDNGTSPAPNFQDLPPPPPELLNPPSLSRLQLNAPSLSTAPPTLPRPSVPVLEAMIWKESLDCPHEKCGETFKSFRSMQSHLEQHATLDIVSGAFVEDIPFFRDAELTFVVVYYEKDLPLAQFDIRSIMMNIGMLTSTETPDKNIANISLSRIHNPCRDDKSEKIRQFIGSGIALTMDKDTYEVHLHRMTKNPIYVRSWGSPSAIFCVPERTYKTLTAEGEVPAEDYVCVFDFKLFKDRVATMTAPQALAAATIRIALVKNSSSDKKTPCWLSVRIGPALQYWEATHGAV